MILRVNASLNVVPWALHLLLLSSSIGCQFSFYVGSQASWAISKLCFWASAIGNILVQVNQRAVWFHAIYAILSIF